MRIAIVNDLRMAIEALQRVVTSVPEYQIAWIANDGEEAVSKCAADVPDLILMDLIMPHMDGAEASRIIMRDSPCAILIVTATVGGHSSKVFEAMGWGALDAVKTPKLRSGHADVGGDELLAKIAMLAKLVGKAAPRPRITVPKTAAAKAGPGFPFIVIGASTGGPNALLHILGELPKPLPAAVAIVQHVDEMFAPGLASWLARQTSQRVRIIRRHDRPEMSLTHVACTNNHLLLMPDLTFDYTSEPVGYSYRPSVDIFLDSVVKHWPSAAIGVLLTGMGSDGAMGLLAMRKVGWHTIAQDQTTSIVYGMPKAAATINAAVEILPLDRIAAAITRALSATAASHRVSS
jgi:two-component system response regulator WspF